MGTWSTAHAANELARQLGLELPAAELAASGDVINLGVDVEARGDTVLALSLAHAKPIADAFPQGTIVNVVRPRFAFPIGSDNKAFLRFLHQLGIEVRFATPERRAEDGCPRALAIYPGLISADVLAALGISSSQAGLIPLRNGLFLVDQALRSVDPRSAPMDVDAMVRLERVDERLFGYCQALGLPLFVNATELAEYARSLVYLSPDLALALGTRALSCARSPIEAASVTLQVLGMKIFLHKFAEVSQCPEPPSHLPEALRRELYMFRGWGRVMTGDIAEAERCFALGSSKGETSASLYGRNIAALAKYRSGDLRAAQAIELEIAASLAVQDKPDAQLAYVNALNLGRLARAAGDQQRFAECVAQAIETTENVRSANEIIQLNLLDAQVHEESDPRSAGFAYLRAAMAWLAFEPPGAIGTRTCRLILGNARVPERQVDDKVSSWLDEKLSAAWPATEPMQLKASPHVMLSDDREDCEPTELLSCYGMALCWSPARRRRLPRAENTRMLAGRAFAIALELLGSNRCPLDGCWIIDCATGSDTRGSIASARCSAWRFGLRLAEGAEAGLNLKVGPAVRHLEDSGSEVAIMFRRQLAPATLSGEMARLVASVTANGGIPVTRLSRRQAQLARELVERRILGLTHAA